MFKRTITASSLASLLALDKWAEVRAGTCSRFDQNTFYVRYDRELYRELFGLDY